MPRSMGGCLEESKGGSASLTHESATARADYSISRTGLGLAQLRGG